MSELILLAFLLGLLLGLAIMWVWYGPRRTRPAWRPEIPTVSGYAAIETVRRAERRHAPPP